MKKNILVALIVGLFLSLSGISQAKQTLESCKDIGEIAKNLMTARQNDAPMVKLIEDVAKGNPLFTEMIIEAYKKPHMSREENKERYIRKFEDYWYLTCIQSMKE